MWDDEKLADVLSDGGIAVMPTDTLYGVVGRAEERKTVEKIYEVRKRNPEKPCIILIGDIAQLEKFSVTLSEEQENILHTYWPGPVSIIFDCAQEAFSYLHRNTNTLAFRLPAPEALRDLLVKTGPLVAPSANPEGMEPAKNIEEARAYFGDGVDLYVDGGVAAGKASKVIRLRSDGSVTILRE